MKAAPNLREIAPARPVAVRLLVEANEQLTAEWLRKLIADALTARGGSKEAA